MTSLTEVYEASEREVSSLRRLYAGMGLVVAGAALAVLAVIVAATDLVVAETLTAREYGGIIGGLAAPVVLVGVFVVLPAGRRIQAAAAISASICLFGVALFWYAYPVHWDGHGQDLTLFVSTVYLIGFFSAIGSLFTAVVNFKTRNDPGGALELNVTRKGETKVVEVERDATSGLGGVGLLGGTPDGDVETQTGDVATDSSTSASASSTEPSAGAPAGDGGSTTTEISSPLEDGDGHDAELVDGPESGPTSPDPDPTDRYCGNCRHFRYVRSSSGMVPYCGFHDGTMEDMDACEEWTANHG
ncbi:DUF7139 domain-containing protein [Natrialbaceae archaeon AArc-T1-2]|uniref:DUF7139 domain-containing protein n=1 Tax=Natrialbaceae archaeon AArc-T1-2 TaxID=3053904 RepID=UPI00255B372D|nr:hypothetical protein [Natrialbaceae archaeon AArc-T1-2]WIV66042.1 hypothetical protein QQ977_10075 [Natrialbaceae archaeon AArc-T1-2]